MGVNFAGANLSGADLTGAFGPRAYFADARLEDATLAWAMLERAILTRANLRRAGLSEANLRGASLEGADLSAANLRGASLAGADMSGVDLSGADLSAADLEGAPVSAADLEVALAGALEVCDTFKFRLETVMMRVARRMADRIPRATAYLASFGLILNDPAGVVILGGSGLNWGPKTNMSGANLRGAVLVDVDLTMVDPSGLNLAGVFFTGRTSLSTPLRRSPPRKF